MDKRKVMKFMQACMEHGAKTKADQALADLGPPRFGDYLDALKIPTVTRRSIVNAIAMCSEDTPTNEVSVGQSINQSINQSIDQASITQSSSKSINQSIERANYENLLFSSFRRLRVSVAS